MENTAATGGGTDTRMACQYVAGTTTRTMNYSMSDADDWGLAALALVEAGTAPTGWTGIVNGLTNPAKVNDVLAANISDVTGVA
jgi:hypothetical protein